ncbi:MAG: PfkB family carbohydrate kinase, partial [Chloroflexota bacterium]
GDPTGGGDAYRAGFIYGLVNDLPLDVAAQLGSLCATYAIEHIGTQSHRYTTGEFVTRYRTVYDDMGILDPLLEKTEAPGK